MSYGPNNTLHLLVKCKRYNTQNRRVSQ